MREDKPCRPHVYTAVHDYVGGGKTIVWMVCKRCGFKRQTATIKQKPQTK